MALHITYVQPQSASPSLLQLAMPGAKRTLIEAAEEKHGKPCKRRQLGRRNSGEAVDRQIQTQWPDWGPEVTDLLRVNGKTLREMVVEERQRLKSEGKSKIGKLQWQDRRDVKGWFSKGVSDLFPQGGICKNM